VWSQSGVASQWSEPAFWIMGLLSEPDWQGSRWIGHDSTLENTQEKMPNDGVPALPKSKPAPHLRKEFAVRGPLRSALLYASGVGYAELHLNGKKIGGDIERDPGFTNFDQRVLYVAHDVASLIAPGSNALGAILGTGWYDVHDIATWHFNTAPWRARPALRLLLALEYADGRTEFVVSDASWKTANGPILRDGIYSGEIYDARLEMPGWDAIGFNDAQWQDALVMPGPRGKLVARKCPPIAVTETFAPVAISEPKPGVFIVDMGRNFSGHTQLRVQATRGTSVTMRYAEMLNPDGTLNSSPIDVFMAKTEPRQPFQQDTYICGGHGEEIWEQRFSYSGFQYVEVTGFPGRPTPDNFRGRFAHTAMESAGDFSCSDETLNKIQQATRRSYLSNAQSYPTDCPQREKNGWTGDAQLAVETGLMNFRSATFYSKWLDDFADAQRPEGGVPVLVPNGGWGNGEGWPGEVTPPWDAAYPVVAWSLYEYRGDTRILNTHYANIRKYVEHFARFEKDGVVPGLGLGDWSPWKTQTPLDYISTAYFYLDVRILSRMAGVIGNRDDEAKYQRLAAKVKQGFHAHFYDGQKKIYANGSQTALAVALFFDLVSEDLRAPVMNRLASDVEQLGHLDVGIIGAKSLLRALSEGGRTDLAYRIVVQPEMPGYGYWISQGATTLWEGWKHEASLNHIMFGDVSNWMIQWIAGIAPDPTGPGFQRVLIQPTPVGGLTWAKARHQSIYGAIESEWKKSGRGFELTIAIPPNVTATVKLPCGAKDKVSVTGVRELPTKDGSRRFFTGSGKYVFKIDYV
jgi:alpha-L-rhamnosidase